MMTSYEFSDLLRLAIAGNSTAKEKIINMYMPLIIKQSTINGKIDEDLEQYIMLKIISNISKFNIEN